MADYVINVIIDPRGATSGADKVKKELNDLGKKSNDLAGLMKKAFAFAGITVGLGQIAQLSEEFNRMEQKIRSNVSSQQELITTQKALNDIARETYASYSDTVDLWDRLTDASKDLGISQDDVIGFTKQLNQVVAMSGATAGEASMAVNSLAKAMEQGQLSGMQLKRVISAVPEIADIMADSLRVSRTELIGMADDGQISATKLVEAFAKAGPEIEAKFGSYVPTLGQRMQVLRDQFMNFIGAMDNALGITTGLGMVLGFLANNMTLVAGVVGSLSILIGVSLAGKAMTALTNSFKTFSALFSASPLGRIAQVVILAIPLIVLLAQKLGLTGEVFAQAGGVIQGVISAMGFAFSNLGSLIEGIFNQAANSVIGAVESMINVVLKGYNKLKGLVGIGPTAMADFSDSKRSGGMTTAEFMSGMKQSFSDALRSNMGGFSNATATGVVKGVNGSSLPDKVDGVEDAASGLGNPLDSIASSGSTTASNTGSMVSAIGMLANGMAALGQQMFQGGSYTGGAVNTQQASAGGGFTGSGFSSGISQQGVGNMGLVGTGSGLGMGSMSSSGTMSFSSSAGPEMRAIQAQLIAFYESIGEDAKAWQISLKSTQGYGGPGWENPLNEWRALQAEMVKKQQKMIENQEEQIILAKTDALALLSLHQRLDLARQNVSSYYEDGLNPYASTKTSTISSQSGSSILESLKRDGMKVVPTDWASSQIVVNVNGVKDYEGFRLNKAQLGQTILNTVRTAERRRAS